MLRQIISPLSQARAPIGALLASAMPACIRYTTGLHAIPLSRESSERRDGEEERSEERADMRKREREREERRGARNTKGERDGRGEGKDLQWIERQAAVESVAMLAQARRLARSQAMSEKLTRVRNKGAAKRQKISGDEIKAMAGKLTQQEFDTARPEVEVYFRVILKRAVEAATVAVEKIVEVELEKIVDIELGKIVEVEKIVYIKVLEGFEPFVPLSTQLDEESLTQMEESQTQGEQSYLYLHG